MHFHDFMLIFSFVQMAIVSTLMLTFLMFCVGTDLQPLFNDFPISVLQRHLKMARQHPVCILFRNAGINSYLFTRWPKCCCTSLSNEAHIFGTTIKLTCTERIVLEKNCLSTKGEGSILENKLYILWRDDNRKGNYSNWEIGGFLLHEVCYHRKKIIVELLSIEIMLSTL